MGALCCCHTVKLDSCDVMDALCGCHTVKFDYCNNLRSSIHTVFVVILRYTTLNIKQKYYYCYYISFSFIIVWMFVISVCMFINMQVPYVCVYATTSEVP